MNLEHLSVISFVSDQVLNDKIQDHLLTFSVVDVETTSDLDSLKSKYQMIFPHMIIIEEALCDKAFNDFLKSVHFNGVIIILSTADKVYKLRSSLNLEERDRKLIMAMPIQSHDLYEKIKKANLSLKSRKIEFQVHDEYKIPKIEAHFDFPLQYISESKIVIESPIRLDTMTTYSFKSRLMEALPINCHLLVVGVSALTRARTFYISLYLKFLGEDVLMKIRQKVAI